MKTQSTSNETRDLTLYFVIAYAISWSIGIPLALQRQGLLAAGLPYWLHYLVAYGPLLSAVLVTGLSEGRPGLKKLWGRMVMWKVQPVWWAVAVSPLLLGAGIALVLFLIFGKPVSMADLGQVNFLPSLGLAALVLWILTFGLGEETGWRGFALPRLQRNRSALSAALILAVFWALWHLPQFFYLFDPSIAVGWLFGLVCGSIVLTWLFNSAGGSVLIVAVWHGCFNFITASDAGSGILAAAVSTVVMLWAVVVVLWFKPQNLSSHPKITNAP
jgi:uncharacterized protein